MSRRKVAPLLLAASVFLTGATTLMTGVVTSAQAITSVEELRDVNTSSWAYQALADLVEKYDVIEGYPDYTFKGNRATSRYELAAALNAVIKAVGRDLARLGAEKANKSDLATLAKLQEEFRNELAALNARTAALESRASAIEAKNVEQDTRLDLLEKTQLHGDVSFGVLADIGDNGTAGGFSDAISALGRVRLGVKVPVIPGNDNSKVGEGDMIVRLVGAFGRFAPQATSATDYGISGYSFLAGDQSFNNEGIRTGSLNNTVVAGSNNRQNVFVESAYLKQHFKSGIPILTDLFPGADVFPNNDSFRTTADMYLGIVPWRNLFNRSPYRGDELNQFQNTSLVNNAGLLATANLPTLAMAWHQGLGEHLSADLTAAVSSFDNSDLMNGFMVTEELALNYDTSFLGTAYTKPGTLYVGGYHIMNNGAQNLLTTGAAAGFAGATPGGAALNLANTGTVNAFYAGMNQEWWRGIGTSVDWVMNSTNSNNVLLSALRNGTGVNAAANLGGNIVGVQHALSAAMSIPLTVFNKNLTSRAKDVIGLGYSYINPTEGTRVAGIDYTNEHVGEVFYRWAVNNSVTVIPSAQVIFNRLGVGNNDTSWVIGLRTNYVF